jgi:tight adherence protein B
MIDFIRASYSVAAGMAFVTVCEQLGADPRVVDGRQQNPPIPIVQPDFKWMAAQLRLNRPLDEVLDQIAAQRHDAILNLVFAALRLQQKYRGAEIAAVLAEIAETVRNLVSVRRRVRAEQTKITWEGRIMCLAPFAFLFLIQITAPAYSRPFYATPMGQIAIIAAGVLSLLAYFIMRRIANSITAQLEIQPYPPLYTAAQLEQSLRQVPQPAAGRSA